MTTNNRRLSMALAAALVLAGGASRAGTPPSTSATTVGATTVRAKGATRDPARAFLKLDVRADVGGRGLYVGQAIPVTIHAYFLGGTGVSLNGLPQVTSDAFMLSGLPDKPLQSAVQIRGLPYTAVTWTGVLTAVKAGGAKLGIQLPVSLTYREAPQRRPATSPDQTEDDDRTDQSSADPFASMLKQSPFANDPFFTQMFNGRDPFQGMLDDLAGSVREREITLHDQGATLRVLDPPPGAPPGFTGAVGSFEIGAALADHTFRVGEPTALELTVRGQGSFSRLSVNGLPSSNDLNTYGVTSTFTPGPLPAAGEKVFTQTIAPRRAGTVTIPAVTLTYFDPHDKRYVTRHTSPIHITVAPSGSDPSMSPTAAAQGEAGPAGTVPTTTAKTDSVSGSARTLTPSFRMPWFRWLAAAIAFAAVALALLGRTYRNGALGRLLAARRVRRQVARQRRAIQDAVARGDANALFGSARQAFQARLGAAWGVPSEAIAAVDVATRLGPPGERIRQVFERADRLTYSGASAVDSEDLNYWQALVSDELRALEGTT
jgi:oxygen tolerance protein BatD